MKIEPLVGHFGRGILLAGLSIGGLQASLITGFGESAGPIAEIVPSFTSGYVLQISMFPNSFFFDNGTTVNMFGAGTGQGDQLLLGPETINGQIITYSLTSIGPLTPFFGEPFDPQLAVSFAYFSPALNVNAGFDFSGPITLESQLGSTIATIKGSATYTGLATYLPVLQITSAPWALSVGDTLPYTTTLTGVSWDNLHPTNINPDFASLSATFGSPAPEPSGTGLLIAGILLTAIGFKVGHSAKPNNS